MNAREWSGIVIRRAVDASGVSQSEIARRMGVDHGWISRLCSGEENVGVETLFRLVEACGLEVENIELLYTKKHDNTANP